MTSNLQSLRVSQGRLDRNSRGIHSTVTIQLTYSIRADMFVLNRFSHGIRTQQFSREKKGKEKKKKERNSRGSAGRGRERGHLVPVHRVEDVEVLHLLRDLRVQALLARLGPPDGGPSPITLFTIESFIEGGRKNV